MIYIFLHFGKSDESSFSIPQAFTLPN